MFKFGYAQENITPKRGVPLCGYFEPRPNVGAHDALMVKAAVFECDGVKGGILSYDLCIFPRSVMLYFKEELTKAGIDFADNLLFAATHSHTSPYIGMNFADKTLDEAYIRNMAAQTVNAVKTALDSLYEAEIYAGKATNHDLAFNRRFWMKDGTVLTNPGKLNPNIVGPESVIDPDIPFFIVKQDGMDRLIIANISNHTDTIGDEMVSADWPGRMEKAIQDHYGYDIPVMTLIGCQGNINHFNVETDFDQTNYAEACRIGKGYAASIISMLYSAKKVDTDSLQIDSEEFEAPYVQISDEEYAAAKATVEELKDVQPGGGKDLTSEGIAAGSLYTKKVFAQRIVDCRENPITEKRIETMKAFKIGKSICIQTIPAEAFVELGFAIKAKSPYKFTMVSGLTMGYIGYTALPECYARGGGYETRPGRTAPAHDLAPKIIDLGIELVNR